MFRDLIFLSRQQPILNFIGVALLYSIPLLNFIYVFHQWSNEGVRTLQGGKFTIYQPIILYRKISADKIFDGYQFLHGKVLITDEIGVIVDIINEPEAGDNVEKLKGHTLHLDLLMRIATWNYRT